MKDIKEWQIRRDIRYKFEDPELKVKNTDNAMKTACFKQFQNLPTHCYRYNEG